MPDGNIRQQLEKTTAYFRKHFPHAEMTASVYFDMGYCYWKSNNLPQANKFAEIVAATVLAGDISLACAVIAGHWVSSHDQMGRNRP